MLEYKVYLQQGYKVNSVKVTLSFDGMIKNGEETSEIQRIYLPEQTLTVQEGDRVLRASIYIDPSKYVVADNSLFRLNIDSVTGTDGTIKIDSYDTFRLGR